MCPTSARMRKLAGQGPLRNTSTHRSGADSEQWLKHGWLVGTALSSHDKRNMTKEAPGSKIHTHSRHTHRKWGLGFGTWEWAMKLLGGGRVMQGGDPEDGGCTNATKDSW